MRKLIGSVGAAVKRADDNFTTSLRAWAARTRDKLDRVSPTPSQLPSHLQEQQRRAAGPGQSTDGVDDPEVAAAIRRAQQRPAMFQRLDHDFSADGRSGSGLLDPDNMLPTRDEEAADVARTAMQARLRAAADDIAAGKPVRVGDVMELTPPGAVLEAAQDSGDATSSQGAGREGLNAAHAGNIEVVELDASEAAAAQAAVSVRRVIASRPLTDDEVAATSGSAGGSGAVDAGEAQELEHEHALTVHDPNPATLTHWAELQQRSPDEFTIESKPDVDSPGARSFAVYEAMQLNPGLLDTSVAIASSPAIRIAAQMAAGYIPPAARGEVLQLPAGVRPDDPQALAAIPALAAAQESLPLAMRLGTGSSGAAPALPSGSTAGSTPQLADGSAAAASAAVARSPGSSSAASAAPVPALQNASAPDSLAARAAAADALVPANSTIDALLLAREIKPPAGMTRWGPRPPDASAFDQLILQPEDDEFALDRGEVFELFARHRADPDYWTPARLAERYFTKPEWVEVLLAYASPPVFANVDGEAYGVYDIRTHDDMHARHERASAAERSAYAEAQAARREADLAGADGAGQVSPADAAAAAKKAADLRAALAPKMR